LAYEGITTLPLLELPPIWRKVALIVMDEMKKKKENKDKDKEEVQEIQIAPNKIRKITRGNLT